jgi:hypothetical protein
VDILSKHVCVCVCVYVSTFIYVLLPNHKPRNVLQEDQRDLSLFTYLNEVCGLEGGL